MLIHEFGKIENIVCLKIIMASAFFMNDSGGKWSDSYA